MRCQVCVEYYVLQPYKSWGVSGVRLSLAETTYLLLALRWIHFVASFTTIGAIFTTVMVVRPSLKKLSPDVRFPLAFQLLPRMLRVQISAAIVLMGAGVGMAWIMGLQRASGGSFMAVFTSTSWGIAIAGGGVLTLILFFNGVIIARPTINSIVKIITRAQSQSTGGITSGTKSDMMKLQKRLDMVIMINFVISLTVLFLMGFAAHG